MSHSGCLPGEDALEQPKQIRDPSLADAIIPLVTLVVLIAGSLDDPAHVQEAGE